MSNDNNKENEEIEEIEVIGVHEALQDAQKKAAIRDYEGAKDTLEETIKKLESSAVYNAPDVEYHTFAAPIEQVIFLSKSDNNKKLEIAPEAMATLYLTYGNLLLGMEDTKGAQAALEKACRWNPVNPNLKLEYADVFRAQGDMEKFFEVTVDTWKTAYTKAYLAHIYRNIGYYFIEKEQWKEAMAAYVLSLHFDSGSEDAAKEIDYIQEKTEGKTGIPSMDEINKIAEENGFSSEADSSIVGLAAFYGHKAKDDGRKDVAAYFLGIAYELTGDSSIGELLQELSEDTSEEASED